MTAHTLPPVAVAQAIADGLPEFDASMDVTEEWRSATDPHGARRENAQAFLWVTRGSYVRFLSSLTVGGAAARKIERECTLHILIGLYIEDGETRRFVERRDAERIFGAETLSRWEEIADKAARDQS